MADHGHDHDHDHEGHGHGHGHFHVHANAAPKALVGALVVTLVFMVVEAVGGYFSNSLALASDAAHMLTDVGALLLSLFVNWMARRPSTRTLSFGYHRVEILGALASGLAIWAIAGVLVYEAVLRMQEPPEVKGPIVFVVAVIGLLANLSSMRMLHHAKDESINVRAAYLHLIADTLGSVGAIVAGAVLWASGWRPIDPIVTVIFSALMLFSSWELVRESIAVLMESAPGHVDPEQVEADLGAIEGVEGVHELHIWSLSSGRAAMSVHLISRKPDETLARAHEVLRTKHGLLHATVQVEHPDKFESDECVDCASGSRFSAVRTNHEGPAFPTTAIRSFEIAIALGPQPPGTRSISLQLLPLSALSFVIQQFSWLAKPEITSLPSRAAIEPSMPDRSPEVSWSGSERSVDQPVPSGRDLRTTQVEGSKYVPMVEWPSKPDARMAPFSSMASESGKEYESFA